MLRQLITFILLAPWAVIAFIPPQEMTGQRSTALYVLRKNIPARSHIQDVELTRNIIMQSYYKTLNDQELTMEVIRAHLKKEGTLLDEVLEEDKANVAAVIVAGN